MSRHIATLNNIMKLNTGELSQMIRCHLSTIMGQHKMKVMDVARETGLNRSTITALYKETASRVDLEGINRLCELFECEVGDLFEYIADK